MNESQPKLIEMILIWLKNFNLLFFKASKRKKTIKEWLPTADNDDDDDNDELFLWYGWPTKGI